MKKYNNFCITWMEDGQNNETVLFCKMDAIREYIKLLFAYVDENRNISSLAIWGVTRREYALEDMTDSVNRFLNN